MGRLVRIASRTLALMLVIVACGDEQAEPSTSTSSTTAPTTSTTTTTAQAGNTVPAGPLHIDRVAALPDDSSLQDGVWAAVVFHQPLECIPKNLDLAAAEPADCERSVLFEGDAPGTVVGTGVPVWLFRWPVLSYALSDGVVTVEELAGLPTLVETESDGYLESAGDVEVEGRVPGGARFRVVDDESGTRFDVPVEPGEQVGLPRLIGDWQSESHLLRVDEGGSYELYVVGEDGSPETTGVYGFVALQDGLLVMPTGTEPGPCPGETGVYFAELADEVLRLHAVDEPCAFRSDALQTEWSVAAG